MRPIQPKTDTFQKNYSNEILDFVFIRRSGINARSSEFKLIAEANHESRINSIIEQAKAILIISSSLINLPEVSELIAKRIRDDKIRCYILVDEIDTSRNFLTPLAGACLIRGGVKIGGSAILCDPNSNLKKGLWINRSLSEEQFQVDNLLEKIGGDDQTRLLLEASNLVCGTTMGILRLFQNETNGLSPSLPPFDYLIVDESSKTTFQEFLVPALYAKKWILAGDIKQLSPFTDRDQIVGNLKNLAVDRKKSLSPEKQKACWYLQKLNIQNNQKTRFIVVDTQKVINAVKEELEARSENNEISKETEDYWFCFISDEYHGKPLDYELDRIHGCSIKQAKKSAIWLAAFDMIFMTFSAFQALSSVLPSNFIVLYKEGWEQTEHAFRNNLKYRQSQSFHNGRTLLKDSFEISNDLNSHFSERSWAEEIVWRMERVFWLRYKKNNTKRNRKWSSKYHPKIEIQRLLPYSEKGAVGKIYRIRDIAFPSILEALTGEGLHKRNHEEPNTLNQGFKPEERKPRYTTLKYQHRMHGEISDFPRKEFYTNTSLLDGKYAKENREWSYSRYNAAGRRCWLNIDGSAERSSNKKEVNAIQKELEDFKQWSKQTPSENRDANYQWEIAVLTFYKKQERALRAMLQNFAGRKNSMSRFPMKKYNLLIKLATVDFFQGQEADLVFLSMVNTYRDGFMDSPNRLNVAVTRARYQLVIVGKHGYFKDKSPSAELSNLAKQTPVFEN